jgi:hypothetical protein
LGKPAADRGCRFEGCRSQTAGKHFNVGLLGGIGESFASICILARAEIQVPPLVILFVHHPSPVSISLSQSSQGLKQYPKIFIQYLQSLTTFLLLMTSPHSIPPSIHSRPLSSSLHLDKPPSALPPKLPYVPLLTSPQSQLHHSKSQ